jgi:uncharacterized protein (UPF0218 family)
VEEERIKTTPKQTLTLTPSLRQELKNPLGILIVGTPKETMRKLADLLLKEKPNCVITVGDIVSSNILKEGLQPKIVIVDDKAMREETQPLRMKTAKKTVVHNPAGTLTPETWLAVRHALRQEEPTQIVVEGEEDLLTLVVILEAPENSLVIYGQPHEGLVVVKVDEKIKKRVKEIVDSMESAPKS